MLKHILSFIPILFFSFLALGQMEKYTVKVNMDDGFESMDGAFALVKVNGKQVKRIAASSTGKLEFDLEFGQDYVVEFHKQYYATKKIDVFLRSVKTEMIDIGCRGNTWHVGMIKKVDGIDYSVLDQPVGKIFFEPESKCFGWDADYSLRVMEKLDQLEAEMEAKKKEFEKSMSDAEKLKSKGDFDGARASLATAKGHFPHEESVAKLEKEIADAEEAAKNEEAAAAAAEAEAKKAEEEKAKQDEFDALVAAGDKALKSENFEEARKKYSAAAKVMPEATAVQTKLQIVGDTEKKRANEEAEKKRLAEEESKAAEAAAVAAAAAKAAEEEQKAKEEAAAEAKKAKESAAAEAKKAEEAAAKEAAKKAEEEKKAAEKAAKAEEAQKEKERIEAEKQAALAAASNEEERQAAEKAAAEQLKKQEEEKMKADEAEAKADEEAKEAEAAAAEEEKKAQAAALKAAEAEKKLAEEKKKELEAEKAAKEAQEKTKEGKPEPKKEPNKEVKKEVSTPAKKTVSTLKKATPVVGTVAQKNQTKKKELHATSKKVKPKDDHADKLAKLDAAALAQTPKTTSIHEHHNWNMKEPGVHKQIALEYPLGVTEEVYMKGNKEITERVVVKEGRGDIYWRIKHPWGGVYYFKNNTVNISSVEFDLYTTLKDENGNIIEPFHIDRVQDHSH